MYICFNVCMYDVNSALALAITALATLSIIKNIFVVTIAVVVVNVTAIVLHIQKLNRAKLKARMGFGLSDSYTH